MSAMMPLTMAMGELAKAPTKNLKTKKAGQFGARAQARVHMQNKTNVPMVNHLRPNCSLRGAHTHGPGKKLSVRGLGGDGSVAVDYVFTKDISYARMVSGHWDETKLCS